MTKLKLQEKLKINQINKKKCMFCRYWYVFDCSYEYEPEVCDGCHEILLMVYELENIAILKY